MPASFAFSVELPSGTMKVSNPEIRFDFQSENWCVTCEVEVTTPDKDPWGMKLEVSFLTAHVPPTNSTAFTWWLREKLEQRFSAG